MSAVDCEEETDMEAVAEPELVVAVAFVFVLVLMAFTVVVLVVAVERALELLRQVEDSSVAIVFGISNQQQLTSSIFIIGSKR